MKKLFILVVLSLSMATTAQTSTENYVVTKTYKVSSSTKITNTDPNQTNTVIQYFDGLGRLKQSVGYKLSPTQKDIITHHEYDDFGREIKSYLPYGSSQSSGAFNTNALSETNNYYNLHFASDINSSNPNPFSQQIFEDSPLNRVLEQTAPGEDWALGTVSLGESYSDGHTIKMVYATNVANEVRFFEANTTLNGNTYSPSLSGGTTYYAANELQKLITKDENWTASDGKNHTTEEFKNIQGQVILKRHYSDIDNNFDGDTNDAGESEVAHDTYYVYDDFGNLTYVLPPKMDASNNTIPISTINSQLNDLGYQYIYDQRNRVVEKKIPGKGWEHIIYDNLDRPVMVQDQLQRDKITKEWLFTKYDILGRVAYTGLVQDNNTRQTIQANEFDGENYEAKVSSGTGYANTYHSNDNYPVAIAQVYTVNYYDNYTFDRAGAGLPNAISTYATLTTNVKGLATGSRVKVLGEDDWITTVTYYDEKARPIYVYSHNSFLGTTDIVESKLDDFTGKLLETKTTHKKTGKTDIVTIDKFEYDHADRLTKQTQNINSATLDEVIVENTYDNLGQLESKGVGGKTNQSRLQTIDYAYNVRGWLKNINDIGSLGSDLFGFQIKYNDPTTGTALYNGNISQTLWNSASSNPSGNAVSDRYNYSYDALNRIISAYDNTGRYDVWGINYDKNGNITSLERDGHTNSTYTAFGQMDNLSYFYDAGNKLLKVSDSLSNDQYGFKDDAVGTSSDSANDYTYDSNGNMLTDQNKGINQISYNHLNLPTQVYMSGGSISYTYDASGKKLRKVVSGVTTDYAGNYIYENNTLQFFNHAEGYVKNNNSVFNYVYQYKDHLGNVRLSYTDVNQNNANPISLSIVEESNYYPFGLKHEGYNDVHNTGAGNPLAQKWGFEDVEFEESLGYNMNEMDFRHYDPAIGRFIVIDPMSEERNWLTPYNFVQNNPILRVDPTGLLDDYGLDTETGQLVFLKETEGDTDTIYTGKVKGFNKEDGTAEFEKDGGRKTFSKEASNIAETKFGGADYTGLIFNEGYLQIGLEVMEFISFSAKVELNAWAFENDKGQGLAIAPWIDNTSIESVHYDSGYSSDTVINDFFGMRELGKKVGHIHTHPPVRRKDVPRGQFTGDPKDPSEDDKKIRNYDRNKKYPFYINYNYRLDGKYVEY